MRLATAFTVALAAALTGCGARPFTYHHAGDMKPGSGMLTGDAGAFVMRVGGKPAPRAATADEAQEFERWQRSAEGTDEYREFQVWRDWKRRNAR